MKRLFAFCTACFLLITLTACRAGGASAGTAVSESAVSAAGSNPFVFTRENFPRLDGSTSTVPLGQAIASALLGEPREKTFDLIYFSKTSQSYRSLIDGSVDLLISAAPPDSVMQELEDSGFAYQMDAFATDALVFPVNENNPVDSLTADQVRDIYTGNITNWNQIGGDNIPIVPFQRNAGAGSQGAMERLVMAGQPMMKAPADYVRGEMGDLVQAVAAYDNSASAYRLLLCARYEYGRRAQAVVYKRRGAESLHDPGWVVSLPQSLLRCYRRKPTFRLSRRHAPQLTFRSRRAAADHTGGVYLRDGCRGMSMTRRLLYVLAVCLLLSGCRQGGTTFFSAVSSASSTVSSSSLPDGYTGVKTYRNTPPYTPPPPLYTRYQEHTDGLTARDNYGILLPYAGRLLSLDNYILDKLPMYGLVNAEGKIVTDPVYSDVWRQGNFLILFRPDVQSTHQEEWGTALDGKFQYIIAAPDGSWVRKPDTTVGDFTEVDRHHLALYQTDDTISILDDANAITCIFAGADLRAKLGPDYQTGSLTASDVESRGIFINWYGTIGCVWYAKDSAKDPDRYQYSLYLNITDGSISEGPPPGLDLTAHASDTQTGPSGFPGYQYFDAIEDPVTGTVYYSAVRADGSGKRDILDYSGNVLLSDYNLPDWGIWLLPVWNGLIPEVRDGCFCYYQTDGACVFRYPIQTNVD